MSEQVSEPQVVAATVRETDDLDWCDLECRFSDGQKWVAVTVAADLPLLAQRIAAFLTKPVAEPQNWAEYERLVGGVENLVVLMQRDDLLSGLAYQECQAAYHSARANLDAFVLRALEDAARLRWVRDHCRVIYYPEMVGEYPIEHNGHAKDQWAALMHRATENGPAVDAARAASEDK